jgi:hypothetical protein
VDRRGYRSAKGVTLGGKIFDASPWAAFPAVRFGPRIHEAGRATTSP